MKKHFDIRVSGRVQGVWFRKNTKAKAQQLSVNGFVRNEKDGSVFIKAEAEPEVLDRFVEWCKEGPEKANVEDVQVSESSLRGFQAFMIQH